MHLHFRFWLLACLASVANWGAFAQEPTALVEDITGAPNAGVEMMDYVFDGQNIDLGSSGVLTVVYFSNCRLETIIGGKATIGLDASATNGGKIDATTLSCQQTATIVTADASEAGASAKRVTPFGEDNWHETTIKANQPIFKWKAETPGAKITITSVDEETPKVILSMAADKTYLIYPADAQKLVAGKPYKIEVTTNDTYEITTEKKSGRITKETTEEFPLVYEAIFSIDPGLELDDNVANRTIRLDK